MLSEAKFVCIRHNNYYYTNSIHVLSLAGQTFEEGENVW